MAHKIFGVLPQLPLGASRFSCEVNFPYQDNRALVPALSGTNTGYENPRIHGDEGRSLHGGAILQRALIAADSRIETGPLLAVAAGQSAAGTRTILHVA